MMTENDKLAIIPFNSGIPSNSLLSLTAMTKSGINTANNKINSLSASGGTNIYAGLAKGIKEIDQKYSSGERIVSMILFSQITSSRLLSFMFLQCWRLSSVARGKKRSSKPLRHFK